MKSIAPMMMWTLAALVLGGCGTDQGTRQGAVPERDTSGIIQQGGKVCRKTGCSGQICADRDMVSTCEWRPDYACYQQATCEVQADGECGFTEDAALLSCLGKAIDGGSAPEQGNLKPCHHDGCSSHVCTDRDDLVTTCEWLPEYACYQQATCERQPDGQCGFTPDAELASCLASVADSAEAP